MDYQPVGRPIPEVELIGIPGSIVQFQLCILPDASGWEEAEIEPSISVENWPPPAFYSLGGLDDGAPSDLLVPLGTFDVEPRSTSAIWVSQYIPSHAEPGVYESKLKFTRGNGPSQVFHMSIRVADVPPILGEAIPISLAIDTDEGRSGGLTSWFDLGRRLGISLVPIRENSTEASPISEDGSALDYGQSVIGLGPEWLASYPMPRSPRVPDPLVDILHQMGNTLEEEGREGKVFLVPREDADRGDWASTRDAYLRVRRADSRLRLGIVGALHPRYLPFADIIVVPWERYDPMAHRSLLDSGGLALEVGYPARDVDANSSGGVPGGLPESTEPRDGYDGSPLSFWWSRSVPRPAAPIRYRIDFKEPSRTESLTIGWAGNGVGADVVVRTGADGNLLTRTRIDWSDPVFSSDRKVAIVDAKFRAPKVVRTVEFEIRGSIGGGPVGIAEIEFAPPTGVIETGHRVEVWMGLGEEGFGSLSPSEPRGDARLLSWICKANELQGFYSQVPVNRGGDALVFWPSDAHLPLSTARAELLRQGLDDIRLLNRVIAVASKVESVPRNVADAMKAVQLAVNTEADERASRALELDDRRVTLIRWLEQVEP